MTFDYQTLISSSLSLRGCLLDGLTDECNPNPATAVAGVEAGKCFPLQFSSPVSASSMKCPSDEMSAGEHLEWFFKSISAFESIF